MARVFDLRACFLITSFIHCVKGGTVIKSTFTWLGRVVWFVLVCVCALGMSLPFSPIFFFILWPHRRKLGLLVNLGQPEETQLPRKQILTLEKDWRKERHWFSEQKGKDAGKEEFTTSKGWFMIFKVHANFHSLRVKGEAASAVEAVCECFSGSSSKYNPGGWVSCGASFQCGRNQIVLEVASQSDPHL